MSDSTFSSLRQVVGAVLVDRQRPADQIQRLIWKIALATWLLMAVGSATRVMNAGLACPDWPLCYGQVVPLQQMNLQVFLEWFHRLDAGVIGFSTLWLNVRSWQWRKDLPAWLPIASSISLILIFTQALLGGFTVTELLRFDIVTAHLGTALLFFTSLLIIYVGLWPVKIVPVSRSILGAGMVAAIAIYLQSLLGAVVGSRWALHQCFNNNQLCTVMNSHLLGVIPATVSILVFLFLLWRSPVSDPLLKWLGWSVGGLLVLQIGLGLATFHFHLQAAPLTVGHQAIGSLLLGSLVLFVGLAAKSQLPGFSRS
jgi:cytochrome c oxidase assembly protein subunit 15